MTLLNLPNKQLSQAFLFLVYALAATIGMLKGGAWAAIAIAGALIMMLLVWKEQKTFPKPDKKTFAFVLLFLASAGGLSFFSPFQDQALYGTFKLATIFVPLMFFSAPAIVTAGRALYKKRNVFVYIVGFGFAVLALASVVTIDAYGFDSQPMTKLNRGISYGLLFGMPFLAAAFASSKKQGFALLGALVLALALTHSRTTQVAAAVGVVVFLLARFWPFLTVRLIGFGMIFSLGWPFFASYAFASFREFVFRLTPTFVARVEIWDYMSHRIAQKPLLGWGIGVSDKLEWLLPHGHLYKYTVSEAAHPHNVVIQLWAEMGVLGLVFGGLACFWLLRESLKLASAYVPYALSTMAMGFVLLLAAYDFWTDSLWGTLALTIYAFACLGKEESEEIKVSLRP